MRTWSRKQAAEITGIPDRRVLFYTEQGIFPDIVLNTGRGYARAYSLVDLFYLMVTNELTSVGWGLQRVKPLLSTIYDEYLSGKSKEIEVSASESVSITINVETISKAIEGAL